MCFKSEIVAEIARLHENSAYSILGVSPDASDADPHLILLHCMGCMGSGHLCDIVFLHVTL